MCNANLHDLYSFFLKNAAIHILMEHESKNSILSDEELNVQLKHMINQPITHQEVIKGISMLKNNNVFGNDKIYNEYIKNTQDCLLNLYSSF